MRNLDRMTRAAAIALIGCAIAACSDKPAEPPAAATQRANDSLANRSLAMYRQLLESKSYELAAPIGQEIVAKYPGSEAANEVNKTLADVVAKGSAIAHKRRLERLWIYQSGEESGGQQTTASIYSSEPLGERIRLILRRHSDWGQSVYLFGSGKGFECGKHCVVDVHFDDAPVQHMKAYAPETGEPAIFISDDKDFIARMSKADKTTIDVRIKGKGAESLVFETGGYDASKFGTPEKGKAKKS